MYAAISGIITIQCPVNIESHSIACSHSICIRYRVVLCCSAALLLYTQCRRCHRPEFFPHPLLFFLPPQPHFFLTSTPQSPFLPSSSSAARLHLLALTCLASSKFNWIANSDNQNPLPPLFPLCVALSRAVASDKHQQLATYRQKKKKERRVRRTLGSVSFRGCSLVIAYLWFSYGSPIWVT